MEDICVVLKLSGMPIVCGILSNAYDGPLNSLVWLSRAPFRRGFKLRRGDVILTGSPVPPQDLRGSELVESIICGIWKAAGILKVDDQTRLIGA